MVVDVVSKYFCNSFSCLGKDEIRDTSMSVPTNVFINLMQFSNAAAMLFAKTISHC